MLLKLRDDVAMSVYGLEIAEIRRLLSDILIRSDDLKEAELVSEVMRRGFGEEEAEELVRQADDELFVIEPRRAGEVYWLYTDSKEM